MRNDNNVVKGKYSEVARAANSHRGVQDVLESDDEDETPGPGAHWNPGMSCFKQE